MADDPRIYARVVHAMAMPFTIAVVRDPTAVAHEAVLAAAIEAIHADLRWADEVFSMWKHESPVSRLARGEVTLDDCSPAVGEVFAECERYREATAGAFNARRPDGAVDPTGIVKTWAVARAAWRLDEADAYDWMIGASGDVLVSGSSADGGPWRIGISDPRSADTGVSGPVIDVVELGGQRRALCTSGIAQHGEHIWNTDGEMRARLAQASVVGTDFVAADAWATAIVAGGTDVALAAQVAGFEVLCIESATADAGAEIVAAASPGWPSVAS